MPGPARERARREAGRTRDLPDAAEECQPKPVGAGLVLRQAFGENRERPERDRAERVRGGGRGLDPVRSRLNRRDGTADDRELAFRANVLFVGGDREVDAEPVVARVIVDHRPYFDAVAPSHEPHVCLQSEVRELELDQELPHEVVIPDHAGRNQVRSTQRTVGAERVEVAGVWLVLDDVQSGEAATGPTIGDGERPVIGHVDRQTISGHRQRLRHARLEAPELDEHAASAALDETLTAIGQRIDERLAADQALRPR